MKKWLGGICSFLWERKLLYLSYFVTVALFLLTFYLYELPLNAFYDGLLFSAFFLGLLSIIELWKTSRQEKQFVLLSQQRPFSSQYNQHLALPDSQLARHYQNLFVEAVIEKEQGESHSEEERQQLMDYYILWTHQIKTPLAALDLLVQTQGDTGQGMKSELLKIDNYLEMMLHYLKMSDIEKDLLLTKVPIREVVQQVVRKYRLFFIAKDLSVLVDVSEEKMVTDEKWLLFILEQLIFNSVKYTNSGTVTIRMRENQLQVSDTGIGILAQDLPRVFEQGYTGYNGRENRKASGLGLSMSQKIAQKLGVHLEIDSVVGEGTTVTLIFPQLKENTARQSTFQ